MYLLRTNLKLIIRNFVREKFYSFLNVAGLAVGMSVVLVIALYLIHEYSYDRFHSKSDRIYRVIMHLEMGGNAADLNSTFPPMAGALERDIPEVVHAVRLYSLDGMVFSVGDKVFSEAEVMYVDSTFFNVFDFQLLAGDATSCLAAPDRVVLTALLASKYFETENFGEIIGETIHIDGAPFLVTGVVEPPPGNSHFKFNALAPILSTAQGRDASWNNMNLSTYVLASHDMDPSALEEKVTSVLRANLGNFERHREQGIVMLPVVQALTDIHLHSNVRGEFEPNGSMATVYILAAIALVVLLLACVNFVNLVTARSVRRAREVGVRKVLGAQSGQLMRHFILESVLLVTISTLLGLSMVELLRRPIAALSGKEIPLDTLLSPVPAAVLLVFVVVLGILAGAYPSFFLSSFKPAHVLKGTMVTVTGNKRMRNILVAVQFWISIVLITSAFLFQEQLGYIQSRKLGFDKENIFIIDNGHRLASLTGFINSVEAIAGVESAASAQFKAVDDYDGMPLVTDEDRDNRKLVNISSVDHDYLRVLNYEFVAGRNFSRDLASDSNAVVLNERAASFLFGDSAVGKFVYAFEQPLKVIGVVKDFNFESLRNEVRPLVFLPGSSNRFVHVRLSPGNYAKTISAVQDIWKQHAPDLPFVYTFLDDEYNALYREETRLSGYIGVLTGLALFIACLGLVGLTAYSAEQRKKEVSVRRVLGASVYSLVVLMSRDFSRIMCISFALAVPVSYLLIQEWLEGFAYRIDVSAWSFVAAGAVVALLGFVVVCYQAIKTALTNPVESLKSE